MCKNKKPTPKKVNPPTVGPNASSLPERAPIKSETTSIEEQWRRYNKEINPPNLDQEDLS